MSTGLHSYLKKNPLVDLDCQQDSFLHGSKAENYLFFSTRRLPQLLEAAQQCLIMWPSAESVHSMTSYFIKDNNLGYSQLTRESYIQYIIAGVTAHHRYHVL